MQGTTSSGSRLGLSPTEGDLVEFGFVPLSADSEGEEGDGDKSKVCSIGQGTDFFLARE